MMTSAYISSASNLQQYTNDKSVQAELIEYTRNRFVANSKLVNYQVLTAEPLVATWQNYLAETRRNGVFPTLQKYWVQLHFPIKKNVSQTEDYKKGTLRGVPVDALTSATGLVLQEPDRLHLALYPSLAGKIPVIVVENRADFITLLQALCYRNEPQPIPDSMGAAMIKGLNNWHRLKMALQYQSKSQVLANKTLYQDRIILLSRIPYSNIGAKEMDLEEHTWLEQSLQIRLEHECTHYFTLRQFGTMSNNMHDEIIADYMGITAVQPHFRADWFLQFIGLENYPHFRASGRLKNYLGNPPLSTAAFTILQRIMKRAADHLETFDQLIHASGADPKRLPRLCTLCSVDLIQMAEEKGVKILLERYHHLQKIVQ